MRTAKLLSLQFVESSERLNARLAGLTDEEFLWEPYPGCWTLRSVSELQIDARGEWQIDYEDEVADPPPFTTLAWRLIHIASGNWIYWEYAFGPGERTFLDLQIPGNAAAAVDWLRSSQEPWNEVLKTLDDADLDIPRATNWGELWPTHKLITSLIVEQTHHGAEIGVLRDLYRNRELLRGPAIASKK